MIQLARIILSHAISESHGTRLVYKKNESTYGRINRVLGDAMNTEAAGVRLRSSSAAPNESALIVSATATASGVSAISYA
jgi:hypothetical protein